MDNTLLKQIKLPNGLQAACLRESKSEVKYQYTEIFEHTIYLRHGIALSDGNCILDVGANIGMFALYALHHWKQLQLYCVEPVPVIYDALQANVQQTKTAGHTIHLINKGISNTPMSKDIEFYPHIPGNSTLYPQEKKREGRYVSDSFSLADIWKWDKAGFLLMLLFYPWRKKIFEKHWRHACRQSQRFKCEFISLSKLIDLYAISTIDLLKIDVEGSEMNVLDGIAPQDWDKIRQIVLECSPHNLKSLPARKDMLIAQGFNHIVIESMGQSHFDPKSQLPCMLYAHR